MKSKQLIIVRKDLKMGVGKLAAQCAHASLSVFLNLVNNQETIYKNYNEDTIEAIEHWVHTSFTKVVVGIETEAEMLDIYNKAKYLKIPCSLILDSARTVFKEPTNTCIALGPDAPEKIDKLTGHLKLLR